ncbi:nephronectin [Hypomesus transpacificus]|uniref:nephronectin n=1 Tax=Hypomesus transpacificus TaxID=137520 RepID=UPI001F071E8C|nr:nephronectin [Hypomesus transpacificus]
MEFTTVSSLSVRQQLLVITMRFIALSFANQHESAVRTESGGIRGLSGPGVCSFGGSMACCLGWRNVNGLCQPVCGKPCVKGECVGPDKCCCIAGYMGQQCEEDVNECGMAVRPCSQRCMNLPGSYRCYCDPGYTLNTDGHTCTRELECVSGRCQFGCQIETGGEVHCLCPPGLHLAKDNRTCEDVNECLEFSDVCPPRRTCKNTFGSFACVCRDGFVLGMLHNSVQCRDHNECVSGSHRCSRNARCVNTDGSYICQCAEEYAGNGLTCWHTLSKSTMYFKYKLSKRTKSTQPLG